MQWNITWPPILKTVAIYNKKASKTWANVSYPPLSLKRPLRCQIQTNNDKGNFEWPIIIRKVFTNYQVWITYQNGGIGAGQNYSGFQIRKHHVKSSNFNLKVLEGK